MDCNDYIYLISLSDVFYILIMSIRLGIDLGGTKTEIIALTQTGEILLRERQPTDKKDYPSLLQSLVEFIIAVEEKLGEQGTIGIAIPGAISPFTHKIKNANTVCLIGKDFKDDLEQALNREVRISNDANCFALSEAIDGAAENVSLVFGVILGTGVGGGIVNKQNVLEGGNRIGGEWGHNPLPWPKENELSGSKCYCGKSGCIETFLSGPALAQDYFIKTNKKITAEEIVKLENQEQVAKQVMEDYYERLAKSLASVINILDPDAVVLGGGMSNIQKLYTEIPKRWMQYIFSDHVETKLLQAKYGDSSGVRGAAWLWD